MAISTIKQPLKMIPVNNGDYGQYIKGGYIQIGKTVIVDTFVTISTTVTNGQNILASFPNGGFDNSQTLIAILANIRNSAIYTCRIFNNKVYPNGTFEASDYHIFGTYQAV